MTRRRARRRTGPAELVEAAALAGAALGLLHAAAGAKAHHAAACRHGENSGTCTGHALHSALGPYVTDGVGGLLLGGAAGVCVVLLWALGKRVLKSGPHRIPRATRPPPARASTPAEKRAGPGAQEPAPQLSKDERRALRYQARRAILDTLRGLDGSADRATILNRALLEGGFSDRQLQARSLRLRRGKQERLVDHDLSWALSDLKRGGLLENPAPGIWRLTPEALADPDSAVDEPPAGDRLSELRAMPYHEYLRTPEWAKTRAAALMRAGHRCSLDSSHQNGLEVHHNTYERLGAELASDLVVLCRECHRRHHRAPPPR